MSNPQPINGVLQLFSGATNAVWSSLTAPLPNGQMLIESDTGIIKRGDRVTLYSSLSVFFNLSTLQAEAQTNPPPVTTPNKSE